MQDMRPLRTGLGLGQYRMNVWTNKFEMDFAVSYIQNDFNVMCCILHLLTRSRSLWLAGVWASWPCQRPGRGPSTGPQPHPVSLRSHPDARKEAPSCHFQHPVEIRHQVSWELFHKVSGGFSMWLSMCVHPHHSQQLLRSQDVSLHLVSILLHLGNQECQAAGPRPVGRGGSGAQNSLEVVSVWFSPGFVTVITIHIQIFVLVYQVFNEDSFWWHVMYWQLFMWAKYRKKFD